MTITMKDWESRAYNRNDLTTANFSVGELVAVVGEDGVNNKFVIAECTDKRAILRSETASLKPGKKYRIQYPYPNVTNNGDFIIGLGFGSYEDTPTLDWMISKWVRYTLRDTMDIELERINSVAIFNVVAPFDAIVDELRLSSETCGFCVKGAFSCAQDTIKPESTTWTSEFNFPMTRMLWSEGKSYTFVITLWPHDYSKMNISLDAYTEDGRGATIPIVLPNLERGEIYEQDVPEFELLPEPVVRKEGIWREYRGDEEIVYE